MQLHKRMSWQSVWQVIEAFKSRQINWEMACQWLGIKRSRLYELAKHWNKNLKDKGWIYRRQSRSRIAEEAKGFLEEELRYIKEESPYFKGHYNFTMLAEQCRRISGVKVHRSTVRRWAIREGFYRPKEDSTGKPCIRFETGAIGLLYQHDSSHHAWLPLTKRNDVLIMTEDDHSRKVVGGLLVPRDTAWHHLCVVRQTLELYGCPMAYYCDNHGIFRPVTQEHTQFSRALAALKIALKFTAKAHPQAKGKIEKRFDYFQRRLPYLCERYKITSLTKANQILKELISDYNNLHIHAETEEAPEKRWQKALEEKRSLLQPIPEKTPLDLIFSLQYERFVRKDGTISFLGRPWNIPKAPLCRTVNVVLKPPHSHRPYTEVSVLYKGSTLANFILSKNQTPEIG